MENKMIPNLRFSEFDKVWKIYKLEDVTKKIQDGTHFSPEIKEKGEFKYITSKNIRPGYLDLDIVDYVSKAEHQKIYKRCNVKLGDVLLTKDGASTGNCCINILDEEFSLLSSVAFIRANDINAINEFIYHLINSPLGQREILRSIAGQAITRITLNKLRNFKFIFPSLPEQTKIANFLTAVDKRISLLQKKKKQLEQYKKGVMQKIFSQEIRFKPDLSEAEGDENGKDFPKWKIMKLTDVCDIKKGQQLNKEELEEIGSYPAINGGIDPSGYTEKWNTNENTISISEGGNSCGYVNFNKTKFWAGGHCYALLNLCEKVNVNFLFQSLKYNEKQIMRLRVGSGLPNIQKGDISNFRFLFPCKLEQQKIANFLSAIDKQIENTEKQIQASQIWKKGLLQKMFV